MGLQRVGHDWATSLSLSVLLRLDQWSVCGHQRLLSVDSFQLSKEAVALFPPSGAQLHVTSEPLKPFKLRVMWGSRLCAQAPDSAKSALYYTTSAFWTNQGSCVHQGSFTERLITQALPSELEGNLASCCHCSVMQSRLTLCNPMNCIMPGLPIFHHLLEFAQTQVHWASNAIQPSHPLPSPSPPALSLSQLQGLFLHELALPIRWPRYWSFSFSISPSNEYSSLNM